MEVWFWTDASGVEKSWNLILQLIKKPLNDILFLEPVFKSFFLIESVFESPLVKQILER